MKHYINLLVQRLVPVPPLRIKKIRANWIPYTREYDSINARSIRLPKTIRTPEEFIMFIHRHFGSGRFRGLKWVFNGRRYRMLASQKRLPRKYFTQFSKKLFEVYIQEVNGEVSGYFENDQRLRFLWRRWEQDAGKIEDIYDTLAEKESKEDTAPL